MGRGVGRQSGDGWDERVGREKNGGRNMSSKGVESGERCEWKGEKGWMDGWMD